MAGKTFKTGIRFLGLLVSLSFLFLLLPTQAYSYDWLARYEGFGSDKAEAIVVDAAGNVYVTGNGGATGEGYNYLTIKYAPDGTQLWDPDPINPADRQGVYNGPDSLDDRAHSVAVDSSGNVYVTGSSDTPSNGYDCITVKYDASGGKQWVSRYNYPPLNGHDICKKVLVDSAGYVFVVGKSEHLQGAGIYDSGVDILILKLNPANGNVIWERTVWNQTLLDANDGLGFRVLPIADIPIDAVLYEDDFYTNIYITASTESPLYDYGPHYLTFKFTDTGITGGIHPSWLDGRLEAAYREPSAMAIDDVGFGTVHVYVTGAGWDEATPADINYNTVKYTEVCSVFDPSDCAVSTPWTSVYNPAGPNSLDVPFDIAVDSSGNAYVTGQSTVATETALDIATVKYRASDGFQLWDARFNNGTSMGEDIGKAIEVDDLGNVYVTGSSSSATAGDDYVTFKYDTAGNQIWSERYGGPAVSGNLDDVPSALVINGSGSVFVTGYSYGSSTWHDFATIKYTPLLSLCQDYDMDGYGDPEHAACDYPGLDCNDEDFDINPGASEICYDTIDNDCDGLTDDVDPDCGGAPCNDIDEDGYGDPANPACDHPELDCNDGNSAINPGASEDCGNTIDDDCDGLTDDDDPDCGGAPCIDFDEDGYGDPANPACDHPQLDCDDGNIAINPGASETPSDGIDSNCSCGGTVGSPGDNCDNCFIATAAFGSPLTSELDSLRAFRDQYLMTNEAGEEFVDFYYSQSPDLASYISDKDSLRTAVRWLLTPIVYLADLLTD